MEWYVLYADGASRGNPGPAGIGVVLQDCRNQTIAEISEPIGNTTNNVAEYEALIRGLTEASSRGVRFLRIYLDSELLVRQLTGEYQVRSPRLLPLWQRATALMKEQFCVVVVDHVRRGVNTRADALASSAAKSSSGGRRSA
jgi:ribonuclease HI